MNILFLTENFPPETNAAATRVYERACYWVKWGHDVTIITSVPNSPEGEIFPGYINRWRQVESVSGIRVVRVKTLIAANQGTTMRVLDFLSFMFTAFFAGLFERRPDLVCATSPQFFSAVCGWALGLARRVPFVFELGDLWPESIVAVGVMQKRLGLRLMEKFELFLYSRSATVIALTHSFKENLMRRGINKNKIAVVLNGVDVWRYGPRARDHDLTAKFKLSGKFVVGYVGTHGMAHALSNVLDTAGRLIDRPKIVFLLAGGGAERDMLMAEATRRKLTNVLFLPRQPKECMPKIWSLCDVALVHLKDNPVFKGVIPSKMFEAMAMGLPIVMAGPKGEASTILKATGAGLHVPAENPEKLAAVTIALASQPHRLAAISAKSLAAAPHYSRETQARLMLDAFSAVKMGDGHKAARVVEVSLDNLVTAKKEQT
ncbi:MAG: glycosyltransferase WbuB [Rhodospirillaceae bacterium TMED8]|nr:glycosyltransferase WbuB [Magnetovibrio sp.]OUT47974.1 MAG: glycosyltransferase WbuB [Rhodospirillaceae bacterium TMED8]